MGPLRSLLGDLNASFYVRTHGPLVHSSHPPNRGAAAPCLRATAEPPLETSSQTRRSHSQHAHPLLMMFMLVAWPLLFTYVRAYVRTYARTYVRTYVRISCCSVLCFFSAYVRTHASWFIVAFWPRGGHGHLADSLRVLILPAPRTSLRAPTSIMASADKAFTPPSNSNRHRCTVFSHSRLLNLLSCGSGDFGLWIPDASAMM